MYGSLRIRGVDLVDHRLLAAFYRGRRLQPLWLPVVEEPAGSRLRNLREAIRQGAEHGLAPWRYHLAEVDAAIAARSWADAELLLSQALLRHARHRALGVVDPQNADPDWLLDRPEFSGLALLSAIAGGENIESVLDRLWPKSEEYWRLVAERATLVADIDTPDPPPIPAGQVLRPADSSALVPHLRLRLLKIAGNEFYDQQLVGAVVAFQQSEGLTPDGIVGPRTLRALNRTRRERIERLEANLERWRWLPEALPETYVRVNIAVFSLTAIERGREVLKMPVIVGLPYRQTPVFSESMKYLVLNPYWEVPRRLAVEDQLPRLRADRRAMAALGFEAALLDNGVMRPVDQIDWLAVPEEPFPYHLRQRPGSANPLGRIKFMLPNEHAIYLHDTPSTSLFDRRERGFSSGCIRVADAVALAEWVLRHQPERWDRSTIEQEITTGRTRTIMLAEPVPVFIVYFTATVEPNGGVRFLFDIYDRDRPIIEALNAPPGH